jgi:hypothetical protein
MGMMVTGALIRSSSMKNYPQHLSRVTHKQQYGSQIKPMKAI